MGESLETVAASAELKKEKDIAFEIFEDRLREREESERIRFLAATGIVQVGSKTLKVSVGCPYRNPERDLRRTLGIKSGRKWRRFKKQLRKLKKDKQIQEGGEDGKEKPVK